MYRYYFVFFFFLFSLSISAQKEGTIDSKNAKLHYKIFGEGMPLLIINGGPGFNSDGFIPLAKEFGKKYMAIIYDQRGTGQSVMEQLNNENITMDLMVEDMEVLRKHLKLEEWTILGHSFGGLMAAYYTSKHPDKVKGIVFSSSGGLDLGLTSYVGQRVNSLLTQEERDSLNYWTNKMSQGDNSYHARYRRGLALAPAYVYNREFIPAIAERLTQSNMQINGMVWSDLRRINYDTKEELREFKNPVLIIQGKNDILTVETAQIAHEVLPNSKLVTLDKCGHYGWLDRREAFFREIHAFLNQKNLKE